MANFIARLNERQQVTFDVADAATIYPSLGSADWRLQVRPYPDSTTILLDSSNADVIYFAGPPATVTFRWPTSAVAGVTLSNDVYDFGFILPGADFELAGWGTVTFLRGVTRAGVAGSPAAPSGSDDTWLIKGAPALSAAPSLASAVAAAAQSAAAAAQGSLTALPLESVSGVPVAGTFYVNLSGFVVLSQ